MNPEESWPEPPEGGWNADDLDAFPLALDLTEITSKHRQPE
ncbi:MULTISPECIES: hypothetical protein [Streptomyces]|nr:hypothetical protein [Streptomyces flavotricini]